MSKTGKNVDWVEELLLVNRRAIILEISNMLWILSGLVQSTLKDVYQIAAKFVPCVLSEECEFLGKNKMSAVNTPPYSPDLVLWNFRLF
jgi:hypothetical protein